MAAAEEKEKNDSIDCLVLEKGGGIIDNLAVYNGVFGKYFPLNKNDLDPSKYDSEMLYGLYMKICTERSGFGKDPRKTSDDVVVRAYKNTTESKLVGTIETALVNVKISAAEKGIVLSRPELIGYALARVLEECYVKKPEEKKEL